MVHHFDAAPYLPATVSVMPYSSSWERPYVAGLEDKLFESGEQAMAGGGSGRYLTKRSASYLYRLLSQLAKQPCQSVRPGTARDGQTPN